jgi:hypothetical protein
VPLAVTVAEGVEKGAAPPPTWRWRRVGERIEEGSGGPCMDDVAGRGHGVAGRVDALELTSVGLDCMPDWAVYAYISMGLYR